MGEEKCKSMEGMKASVGDGNWVAFDDQGSGESSLSAEEEESCSVKEDEHGSTEKSNFRSSSFSSEMTEDASSSSSSSSFFSSALFEFSDLMANLPIKRGLSRYYDGKSQSFTCLGRATSLEDLIKKDYNPYNKRMKSCKSSDHRHHRAGRFYSPKATISKKGRRNSSLPSTTIKRVAASSSGTIGTIINPGSMTKD